MFTRIAVAMTVLIGAAGCPRTSTESGNADARDAKQSPRQQRSDPREPGGPFFSFELSDPREVLAAGHITVDVMELMGPPRLDELTQRLLQSVRQDSVWWLQQVAKAKPGQPLPYDPRLGLTEAEYEEYLALSNQLVMRKKSDALLVIIEREAGVYALNGGEELPDLTGIEIDLKNDVVRTPFGEATKRSEIDAPEDSALGAWNGVQWKLSMPDNGSVPTTIAKLALGKLESTGRAVLYYDVIKIIPDGKIRISHVLQYDLPR